jgi:superfamily II RNA helicase
MAGRAGRRGKDDVGYVLYLPDRDPSTLDDVRRMMTGGSIRVSSQMDFGYDFLIKTFYGKDLDWKDIARNTYWYQQRQEGIARLRQDLEKLTRERDRFDMTPAIMDDLTKKAVLEKEFRESVNAKRKEAQRKLEQWKNTHVGPRWEQLSKSFVRFNEISKEIVNITEDIDACIYFEKEIEPRLEFLKTHHYLEEPLGPYAANIHEGNPLLMSFAFHHKILHTLPLDQLMGCLTMFSGDEDELSIHDCTCISENTLSCIERLSVETHLYTTLNFYWVDTAIRWIRGEEAGSICSDYQIYEGNFIRAMLKLANLADEWTTMATASSDIEQLELLRDIRQKIVRGIVVPDSLYLRI